MPLGFERWFAHQELVTQDPQTPQVNVLVVHFTLHHLGGQVVQSATQRIAPAIKYTLNICGMEGRKEMFYLTTHSTHFIYGYMASDIWLRTILIVRKETRCHHIGYSYRLTARVLLYAPSHRQDNTYHGLCYTSRGAQWVHPMKDRSDDPSHHERTLYL